MPLPTHTHRLNLLAIGASVTVAAVLVAAKLWAFGVTGSLAVAASLADSALDLMVSLGGLVAMRYAARPPDAGHAFGHSSAEDLAALGQSLFVLVSAAVIGVSAVMRLTSDRPADIGAEAAGMTIMLLSIALTLALVILQGRVARRTGNRIVMADRLHYLGDLIPNLGALAALGASAAFDLGQVDSVIALGTAAMLAVGAVRIGFNAANALMDRSASPQMIAAIEAMAADWPGVRGFHDLKTRVAGSRVFVNLHIELDGDQSLYDAHEIGAGLRHAIREAFPETEVIIHKDPVRNRIPPGPSAR